MTPMKLFPRWLLVSACLLLPTLATASDAEKLGPPDSAPSRAAVVNMVNNCFSCHGPDGRSPGAIPSLTNLTADQAFTTLKEFKSGARSATVMTRHAKGYSDAELEAIAQYLATQLK